MSPFEFIKSISSSKKDIMENEKDYNMFLEKYAATEDLSNISFHQVETIQEVFGLVFEDN